VERDPDPAGVDPVFTIGGACVGDVDVRRRRGGHEARLGSPSTLWRIRIRERVSRRPGRLTLLPLVAVGLVALVACGADDQQAIETLPPIRTTTTSSTTTSIVDERIRLYTVKKGENLSLIARSFGVPLQFLIDANGDQISDPNNVPPGVTLKIPPYVIVDELPTPSSTEAP
jgi:nucleoid-associated protein YgaU